MGNGLRVLALLGLYAGFTPALLGETTGGGGGRATLPPEPEFQGVNGPDWLLDGTPYRAGVYQGTHEQDVLLSNGLVRRRFRLSPNAATVGFDNLITGESVIRGVKPEARVEIDGVAYDIGGLQGQPNYAYLREDWVDQLTADPDAFQFTGFEVRATLTVPPGTNEEKAHTILEKAEKYCLITNSMKADSHLEAEVTVAN